MLTRPSSRNGLKSTPHTDTALSPPRDPDAILVRLQTGFTTRSATLTMNMNTVTSSYPSRSLSLYQRHSSTQTTPERSGCWQRTNGEGLVSHKAWDGSITKYMVRDIATPLHCKWQGAEEYNRLVHHNSARATRATLQTTKEL